MERPKTVRVLAAPGKMIRFRTATGAAGLVGRTSDDGARLQVAVYISDAGLWDPRSRKLLVEGPVEQPNDSHTRKLLSDGDLVKASQDEKPKTSKPRHVTAPTATE